MKYLIYITLCSTVLITACNQPKEWKQTKEMPLGDIAPIGLTYFNNNLWVSDGDGNRIVALSKDGTIQKTVEGFERPMHMHSDSQFLYIPSYGSNQIIKWSDNEQTLLSLSDSLDAPAGIFVLGNEIAIADFYNHRILYFDGNRWISIGHKGKEAGAFHYPTDVHITTNKLYVADAYNHRVQVFDKKGKFSQLIGEQEGMNATTGIYVSNHQVFATDFENDRVLIFDKAGNVEQVIEGLDKPTDLIVMDNRLFVADYKGKRLIVLE